MSWMYITVVCGLLLVLGGCVASGIPVAPELSPSASEACVAVAVDGGVAYAKGDMTFSEPTCSN